MDDRDGRTLSTVQRNAKNAYTYAIARCSSVALTSMESRMILTNDLRSTTHGHQTHSLEEEWRSIVEEDANKCEAKVGARNG